MENKLIWDLNDLFKSNEEVYEEIKKINKHLLDISQYKEIIFSSNILLTVLDFKWNIKEKANNVLIYASLNYYKNIESKDVRKMKEIAESLVVKLDAILSFIDEKIIDLGENTISDYLCLNKGLKNYELYLKNLFRLKNHHIYIS